MKVNSPRIQIAIAAAKYLVATSKEMKTQADEIEKIKAAGDKPVYKVVRDYVGDWQKALDRAAPNPKEGDIDAAQLLRVAALQRKNLKAIKQAIGKSEDQTMRELLKEKTTQYQVTLKEITKRTGSKTPEVDIDVQESKDVQEDKDVQEEQDNMEVK